MLSNDSLDSCDVIFQDGRDRSSDVRIRDTLEHALAYNRTVAPPIFLNPAYTKATLHPSSQLGSREAKYVLLTKLFLAGPGFQLFQLSTCASELDTKKLEFKG